MLESVEYPADFWTRAYELVDKLPRVCEGCSRVEFRAGRFKLRVRLVLWGKRTNPPTASQLRMMCQECCPDTKMPKMTPRLAKQMARSLFDSDPDQQEAV